MTTLEEEFEEAIDTLEALAGDEETQAELLAEFDGRVRDLAQFCGRLYELANSLSTWALAAWPEDAAQQAEAQRSRLNKVLE